MGHFGSSARRDRAFPGVRAPDRCGPRRAAACLLTVALALLLGAGAAQAQSVTLVDEGLNLPGAHAPTGSVEAGNGQFTITWQAATTGPGSDNWFVLRRTPEGSTTPTQTTVTTSPHTVTDLDPGSWEVCIARGRLNRQPNFACATVVVQSMIGFSSASVNGTALSVTFSENLATTSAPAGSVFTVKATPSGGGTARTIRGTSAAVTISGATASATLASAVRSGETVTVSYAKPATNPLQDADSDEVADFSDQSVGLTTRCRSSPARG